MPCLVFGNNARIERSSDLPNSTLFGACCWVKRTGDWDNYMRLISFGIPYTSEKSLNWHEGFETIMFSPSNLVYNSPFAVLDAWYFVALSCAGTGASDQVGRIWDASGALLRTLTLAGETQAATRFTFGNDGGGGNSNRLKGKLAYGRVWSGAAPSQADFEAEQFSTSVVRTSNLYSAFETSVVDVSGNSRQWTWVGNIGIDYLDDPIAVTNYKTSQIVGVIDNASGLDLPVELLRDE